MVVSKSSIDIDDIFSENKKSCLKVETRKQEGLSRPPLASRHQLEIVFAPWFVFVFSLQVFCFPWLTHKASAYGLKLLGLNSKMVVYAWVSLYGCWCSSHAIDIVYGKGNGRLNLVEVFSEYDWRQYRVVLRALVLGLKFILFSDLSLSQIGCPPKLERLLLRLLTAGGKRWISDFLKIDRSAKSLVWNLNFVRRNITNIEITYLFNF